MAGVPGTLRAMGLTWTEQCLVAAAETGAWLNLFPGAGPETVYFSRAPVPEEAGQWGRHRTGWRVPRRVVRATVIRELLRGRLIKEIDPLGVRLVGVRIVGRLDLDQLTSTIPLTLAYCYLPEGITAANAHLHDLQLWSCTITTPPGTTHSAVCAPGLRLTRSLSFHGSTIVTSTIPVLFEESGTVRLPGAQIGGDLDLARVKLTSKHGPALVADGLAVNGSMSLGEAVMVGAGEEGAVRLPGAQIGGHLKLERVEVTNRNGPALNAEGLTVANNTSLKRAKLTGSGEGSAVRLLGARIGGQLGLQNARIVNETGSAITAGRLTVAASMSLEQAKLTGSAEGSAVRLNNARIGGQLIMLPKDLSGGVRLDGADITDALHLDPGLLARKDLPLEDQWVVDHLTYGSLAPASATMAWLGFLRCGTTGYAAQPYQHLATHTRAAGHDHQTREILIAQRDHQLQNADTLGLTWKDKGWGKVTKVLLGYGYKPARALAFLALNLALAVALTWVLGGTGLTPTTTSPTTSNTNTTASQDTTCNVWDRIDYAITNTAPIPRPGTTPQCTTTNSTHGTWITWTGHIQRATNWALLTLFAAGFTTIIRKAN